MTLDRLRATLQLGVLALLFLVPLPFGSVQPGPVLAIELTAAVLGLITILLIHRDADALSAVPRIPLLICTGVIALGIFQIAPLPFALAETFNPTVELVRPLVPYLGLDRPPTVAWSVAPAETTDALLRFIGYVLIGLASAVAFDTDRSRRRFAIIIVLAGVFQAAYGTGEYLTGRQHIFGYAKKYYLDSATGTLINRNHFATLLAIALPFALTIAIPRSTRREPMGWRERLITLSEGPGLLRVFAVLASALVWMGLLLSHSRAGLAAALAGAAFVLVRFRSVRAARWAGTIGIGLLLVLLSAELAQAPGERFLALRDDMEARGGRLTVWRDSAALIASRPLLGWGLGTFESAFPAVQSARVAQLYDHAHSDWVEWATEGGILALAAAVALFITTVRVPRPEGTGAGFRTATSIACQAAVIAAALHASWDFSLRIPAIAVMSAAVMGVALGAGRRSTGSDRAVVDVKSRWW